jgi:lipopolysaccharide transport system ATP-binding protein
MCSDVVLEVQELSKTYQLFKKPWHRLLQIMLGGKRQCYQEFHAVKPLSFTLRKGEALGIIGQNGSGKSTLLQMICGTLTPTSGSCTPYGRISALLELGAGFNPEFTGYENIYLNAAILGLSRAETDARYDEILNFSGIGDKIHQPVKTYSSGMYIRLAFAIAIAIEPDILIVDEALAVGDELFQRKCFARIRSLQEQGTTILFVSHSARTIQDICTRVLLLDQGELLFDGAPKNALAHYHRLLYAAPEQRIALREDIKQALTPPPETDYLPTGTPESQISYTSRGAMIEQPVLYNLEGKPVNLLERGKTYEFAFDVRFTEEAKQVRFGMMIKTPLGINIGGASARGDQEQALVKAGSICHIRIRFKASLFEGNYFMNCGCSAMIDDERIFLHRIEDALMFRIKPEKENDSYVSGIVDFAPQPVVVCEERKEEAFA